MADVSAARTKAVFEFKSATLPLIAVILKTTDLGVLAEALDAQLADSPDFFEQEPVVIDLSQLPEASAEAGALDFEALRGLLANPFEGATPAGRGSLLMKRSRAPRPLLTRHQRVRTPTPRPPRGGAG
ncbi:septum site-determining protein MinC, partial [Variovorax sp. CT11-76]